MSGENLTVSPFVRDAVTRSRLVLGLSAAFAVISVVFVVLGVAYNPAILFPAVLFGAVAYLFWEHGTGRLMGRLYDRVERQAAHNAGPSRRGDGAGPKGDWTGPRRGRRGGRRRTRRRRALDAGGPGLSRREAYDVLGLDPDADRDDITAAYRARIKDAHPDAEDGDTETFKRVSAAYERLTDDANA